MNEQKINIIWKSSLVCLAILFLYFETSSYNATRGSIGQFIIYPVRNYAFEFSAGFVLTIGIVLMFIRKPLLVFGLVAIIVIILWLFYPHFDMTNKPYAL